MNNLEQLLTRARAAASARERATKTEYDALVNSAASGADLDAEKLPDWLAENRFTVTDFVADVRRRAERLSAAEAYAAGPAAQQKLASASRALEALKEQFERDAAAAKANYDAAVAKLRTDLANASKPHEAERVEASAAVEAASVAVDKLRDTASEELKSAVRDAESQIAAANERIGRLRSRLSESERATAQNRAELNEQKQARVRVTPLPGESPIDAEYRARQALVKECDEKLARIDKFLDEQREAIEGAEAIRDSWQRQIEGIRLKMLIV